MKNVVYNSDCLPAMRKMKDNEFDLAIVDPPYGMGNFSTAQSKRKPYNRKWDFHLKGMRLTKIIGKHRKRDLRYLKMLMCLNLKNRAFVSN